MGVGNGSVWWDASLAYRRRDDTLNGQATMEYELSNDRAAVLLWSVAYATDEMMRSCSAYCSDGGPRAGCLRCYVRHHVLASLAEAVGVEVPAAPSLDAPDIRYPGPYIVGSDAHGDVVTVQGSHP